MNLTENEILFLKELIGSIDSHLLFHILKYSKVIEIEDVEAIACRLYSKLEKEHQG